MIAPARAAEILRLYHAEKWKPGTLARQLGVHHDTVRRVLAQAGQTPGGDATRPSLVDPFVPLIEQTLEKYPTLRASRLYVMACERGYTGGPDHFRHVVARYRPAPAAEAYLRLRTLPGEHYGQTRVMVSTPTGTF
jgi:transposase